MAVVNIVPVSWLVVGGSGFNGVSRGGGDGGNGDGGAAKRRQNTKKKIIDVEQKGKSEIKKTQRKEKRGSSKGTMKGNYETEKGEAK